MRDDARSIQKMCEEEETEGTAGPCRWQQRESRGMQRRTHLCQTMQGVSLASCDRPPT